MLPYFAARPVNLLLLLVLLSAPNWFFYIIAGLINDLYSPFFFGLNLAIFILIYAIKQKFLINKGFFFYGFAILTLILYHLIIWVLMSA